MQMPKLLSTEPNVVETSDHFFAIADALHRRLNTHALTQVPSSVDLYGLLVEEYGLRARASILRNSAKSHVILDGISEHSELLSLLNRASETIPNISDFHQLRALTSTISTLCVSICPGKGRVVDFMVNELQHDLDQVTVT
jgi:hypothetical protein